MTVRQGISRFLCAIGRAPEGEYSKMDWGSACFFLLCAIAVLGGAAFDDRKKKLLYLERLTAIEREYPRSA